MLEKVKETLWWLVSVTDWAGLVKPTSTVPKLKLLTERVTGSSPVPVRVTVCGLLLALSAIESVADAAPTRAPGAKVMLILHEACAPSDVPQVVVEMANALAETPVMVLPERVMAVLLLFVSLTVFAALVVLIS
jgi:hypothetical protein